MKIGFQEGSVSSTNSDILLSHVWIFFINNRGWWCLNRNRSRWRNFYLRLKYFLNADFGFIIWTLGYLFGWLGWLGYVFGWFGARLLVRLVRLVGLLVRLVVKLEPQAEAKAEAEAGWTYTN